MSFSRVAGLAGLAFILIVIVANVLLQLPTPLVAGASAVAPAAWVCLVVFSAGAVLRLLPSELRRREGWSIVGMAGPIMQNALFGGVVATQTALLAAPSDSLEQLHLAYFGVNGAALTITLLGFSIAGWRTDLLPRWHAGIGLLGAALLLASALGTPATLLGGGAVFDALGLAGFVCWLIWVPTFGVLLIRQRAGQTLVADGRLEGATE